MDHSWNDLWILLSQADDFLFIILEIDRVVRCEGIMRVRRVLLLSLVILGMYRGKNKALTRTSKAFKTVSLFLFLVVNM